MTVNLQITHSPVENVSGDRELPDLAAFSVEDMRNCFPGRTTIVIDGQSAMVFDDAPLLGLLVEVSELWDRILRGASTAELVDFYGEYKLVMRVQKRLLVLENEFSGVRVSIPHRTFVAAARVWSESLLRDLEQRHPGLNNNPSYVRLKAFIQTTWVAGSST